MARCTMYLLFLAVLFFSRRSDALPATYGITQACGKTFKVTALGYRCATPVTVSTDQPVTFTFTVEGKVDSSVFITTQFEHGSHALTLVRPDGSNAPATATATGNTVFLDYSILTPGRYSIRITSRTPVCATMLWVQVVPNGNHPFLHPEDRSLMTSFYNSCCLDSTKQPLDSTPCQFLRQTIIIDAPVISLCQSIPNTCDNQGRITSLRLRDGGKGAFSCGIPPPALGQLFKLRQLDLSGNDLAWDLTDLVNVWNTRQNERTMLRVHLAGNRITGRLDCTILKLFPQLESLRLETNSLSGGLPACFLNSPSLLELGLSSNWLQGSIPDLSARSPLRWLNLKNNSFTGAIPASISGAQALAFLDLSSNQLSGEVPPLPSNLTVLDLDDNQLTSLPVGALSDASSLMNLAIMRNGLQGELPQDLLALPSLVAVYLSSNRLGGSLDLEWATPDLRLLHADDNQFRGFLPRKLAAGKLYDLRLQQNQLNGVLDGFVDALPISNQLMQLNLSYNQLEGTLPAGLKQLAATKSFDILALGLYGRIHALDLSHNMLKDMFPNWLISSVADPAWKPDAEIFFSDPDPTVTERDNTIYCPVTGGFDASVVAAVTSMYSGSCNLPQNGTKMPLGQALDAASKGLLLPGPPDLLSTFAPVPVGTTGPASAPPKPHSHKKKSLSDLGIALIVISSLLLLALLDIFVLKTHRKLLPKESCRKLAMVEFPEEVVSSDSQSVPVLSNDGLKAPSSAPLVDEEVGMARSRVAG